jgi:hypothetical protein
MKKPSNLKNILAFMLLIVVTSACKDTNTDKSVCIYCGKGKPNDETLFIILNNTDLIPSQQSNEKGIDLQKNSYKSQLYLVNPINSQLCSMKCYSNFKNTFYPQNRDSIFSFSQEFDPFNLQPLNVWIFNEKRKSIQDY